MNKKYFFLFLFCVAGGVSLFSQKSGGEIVYKKLSLPYEYEIKIIVHTKLPSISNYDSVKIFTGDGDSAVVARIDSAVLCNSIMRNTYLFIHTYPGNGMYLMNTAGTNNLSGIVNFPNSSSFSFALYDTLNINTILGNLNSVQFLADPITRAGKNKPLKYNLTAYYPDNDSLSYSFLDMDNSANQYFIPNGFTINKANGEVLWNQPTISGTYQFTAVIHEWRKVGGNYYLLATTNKVFSILIDTLYSVGKFLGISNWAANSNGDYESHISPKANFSASLVYQDSLADSVDLFSYSETFLLTNPSTFTTFSGSKQKIGFYNWTPDSFNIRSNPYIITFRGRSYLNSVCHEHDLTLMIYVDPLLSISETFTNGNQTSIYPNPAHNRLTIEVMGDKGQMTNDKYTATIKSIFGQTLLEKTFTSKTTFNVSNWASGMLFVELRNEKGMIVRIEKVLVE